VGRRLQKTVIWRWRAWRLMSVGDVPGSKSATFSSVTLPSLG